MSETQTPLPVLEVTRNDTTVKYVSVAKKRSATPGELYYAPDQALGLDTVIKHIGADNVLSMLLSRWNLYAQRWFSEACLTEDEQQKPFDADEFVKYATDFSARGLTIAALNEEIAKLTDQLTEFISGTEFLSLATADERKAAITPKVARIQELKAAVAARKNKKEDAAGE